MRVVKRFLDELAVFRGPGLARTLLSAFLLLVLMPLLVNTGLTIWLQYQSSQAQVADQLTAVATLKEAELKTWYNSLPMDLELLVANTSVSANISVLLVGQHNEFVLAGWRQILVETLIVAQASGRKFEEVFLADQVGRVIVSTHPDREGSSIADQAFFNEGLKGSYLQPPMHSNLWGQVVVIAATPVRDEKGTVRGVLVGTAGLSTLDKIMRENAGLGETGETYLVGDDASMLTEPRHKPGNQYPQIHTVGVDLALQGRDGFGLYNNYQNPAVPVLGVYRWIPEMRVALLAEQSQAEAFAPIFQNLQFSLALAFITVLVTIVAMILVARNIAAPLGKLTEAATRLARGNLDEYAPVERHDEIGSLAMAFNVMTVQLRELIGGLEERVATRTAELERQSEALRQSQQRLSMHIQRTPLGAIEWNPNFQVVSWNPGAESIFGYRAEEAIGCFGRDLIVPPSSLVQVDQAWQGLLSQSDGMHIVNENVTRSGQIITCEWYNTPLVDQGGNVFAVASLVENITERQQTQAALQQFAADLQARNEELDAFAHTVAHDLKSPLASIVGFAELLIQDIDDLSSDQIRKSVKTILQGTNRLNRIIEELLLLAGVRKKDVVPQPLDMSTILHEAMERLSIQIQQNDACIEIRDIASWPLAVGYAPWVEEVWANYLSNALKYGGKPSCVTVGAELTDDGKALFWVQDNGYGLSALEQATLFIPFSRLDRVDASGHGLGLSIVRRIIEKLHGTVGVQSVPNQGSRFYFTLPLVQQGPVLEEKVEEVISLGGFPAEWLGTFSYAVRCADWGLARALLAQVQPEHPGVVQVLFQMIDDFEYDRVIKLIEAAT